MDAIDTTKSWLDTLAQSKTWNYVLIGTAILTVFVALRNIYIVSEEMAKQQ